MTRTSSRTSPRSPRSIGPALACALLFSAPSVIAQVAPRAAPATTATDAQPKPADETRELRRILHLSNGQTIRVVARLRGDHWEYKSKDAWKELAPGQVQSVMLESDALKAWNARRGGVDAQDLKARVALASSALDQGLLTEALEELDRVLAVDPECADVRTLLAARPAWATPSIDVPASERAAAQEALLRWGAAMPSACGRELAVLELGKLEDRAALQADLARELRSNIVTRRSFATLALRRLCPSTELKPLVLHAVLDPSQDVRKGASLALRTADDPALILPITRVLTDSTSSAMRTNAAEALGTMGFAAAVEPLISRLASASALASSAERLPHAYIFTGRQFAYIQDFDVEVAQNQAVADPQINVIIEGMVTEAAVAGVNEVHTVVETSTIRKSLEMLTGASPGKTSKDWLKWWEANAGQWRKSAQQDKVDLDRPATRDH